MVRELHNTLLIFRQTAREQSYDHFGCSVQRNWNERVASVVILLESTTGASD